MSHKPEDLDRDVQALFRNHSRQLAIEPFVSSTLKRVESRRSLAAVTGWVLRALVLLGIALFSPLLIQASAWLSNELDELFAIGGRLLGSPAGTLIAVLGVISVVLVNRKLRLRLW